MMRERTLPLFRQLACSLVLCGALYAQAVPAPAPVATSTAAQTSEVPKVPGLSSFLHGFNAGITLSGLHDAQNGYATLAQPAIGYTFNSIFSVDITIPVYLYRLAAAQDLTIPLSIFQTASTSPIAAIRPTPRSAWGILPRSPTNCSPAILRRWVRWRTFRLGSPCRSCSVLRSPRMPMNSFRSATRRFTKRSRSAMPLRLR